MASPDTIFVENNTEDRTQFLERKKADTIQENTPAGIEADTRVEKLSLLKDTVLDHLEDEDAQEMLVFIKIREALDHGENILDAIVLDEEGRTPKDLRELRKLAFEEHVTKARKQREDVLHEAEVIEEKSRGFFNRTLLQLINNENSSQKLRIRAEEKKAEAESIGLGLQEEVTRWNRQEKFNDKKVFEEYLSGEAMPWLSEVLKVYISEDKQEEALEKLGKRNLLLMMYAKPENDEFSEEHGECISDRIFKYFSIVRGTRREQFPVAKTFLKDAFVFDSLVDSGLLRTQRDFILGVLPSILGFASEEERELLVQSIDQSLDESAISAWLNDSEKRRVMAPGLDILLWYGAENTRQLISRYLEGVLVQGSEGDDQVVQENSQMLRDFSSWTYDWDDRILDFRNKNLGNVFVEVLGKYLNTTYRIGNEVARSWVSEKPYGFKMERNLYSMENLERANDKSVNLLYRKYGIHEFHRYPLDILMRQVEIDGEDKPYGLVIYPRFDHNDAYDQDVHIFEKLRDNIQGRYDMRIIEVGSGVDLYRKLSMLRKSYSQKIAFLVIAGHGDKDLIDFGGDRNLSRSSSIEKSHLEESDAIEQVRDMFVEKPSVILFSCSTGIEDGIAQELSLKLDAEVIAPKKPTHPIDIDVQYDENGKPSLNAEYDIPLGQKAHYKSGAIV